MLSTQVFAVSADVIDLNLLLSHLQIERKTHCIEHIYKPICNAVTPSISSILASAFASNNNFTISSNPHFDALIDYFYLFF